MILKGQRLCRSLWLQKEGNITLEINVDEHDLQTGHVSAATSDYINIRGSTKHDTKNRKHKLDKQIELKKTLVGTCWPSLTLHYSRWFWKKMELTRHMQNNQLVINLALYIFAHWAEQLVTTARFKVHTYIFKESLQISKTQQDTAHCFCLTSSSISQGFSHHVTPWVKKCGTELKVNECE